MDFEHFDLFNAAPGEVLGLLVDVEPSAMVMCLLMSIDRTRLSDTEAVTFLQVRQRLGAWRKLVGRRLRLGQQQHQHQQQYRYQQAQQLDPQFGSPAWGALQ